MCSSSWARTCEIPTTVLEEAVTGGGNQASLWINDFPKGGGLPIMIDGQIAGAVGVGGPELQDECAQAGIDAILTQDTASAQ